VLWRIWQLYGRSMGEDHPLIELFVMLGLAGVQTHMLNSWAERQIDDQQQQKSQGQGQGSKPGGQRSGGQRSAGQRSGGQKAGANRSRSSNR